MRQRDRCADRRFLKSQETELKKQAEQAKKLLTEQFKDNDEAKELIDDCMDYYVDSIESTTKTA